MHSFQICDEYISECVWDFQFGKRSYGVYPWNMSVICHINYLLECFAFIFLEFFNWEKRRIKRGNIKVFVIGALNDQFDILRCSIDRHCSLENSLSQLQINWESRHSRILESESLVRLCLCIVHLSVDKDVQIFQIFAIQSILALQQKHFLFYLQVEFFKAT